MYYEAFDYHCSNTAPVNNEDLNIFGVELEIDNPTATLSDLLDGAVEENIITVPYNDGETRNKKTMEYDGSVWREIILNADTPENILKRVKCLNDYGINPEYVHNTAGTSCHIHINRAFLNDLGITASNILKMFEFFAPVIFLASGRNERQFLRWATPQTYHDYINVNWKDRGEAVSHISPQSHERYLLVNCTNSHTIELRGFSNKSSFNYNDIKFFLDFVMFCINQAEQMQGKYYRHEWENLINNFKEWVSPEEYRKYNFFLLFEKDLNLYPLRRLQHDRYVLNELNMARLGHRSISNFVHFLTERIPEYKPIINNCLTLSMQGVRNASLKIYNTIQAQQGEYMNFYYMNKHILNKINK